MDKKIIDILWNLLYNIQVSICRKIFHHEGGPNEQKTIGRNFQTDAEGKGGGY